jgi:hypothetical protein
MTTSLGERAIEQRVKRVCSIIKRDGEVFIFYFIKRGFLMVTEFLPQKNNTFHGVILLPQPMIDAYPDNFIGRYDEMVEKNWLYNDLHAAINSIH